MLIINQHCYSDENVEYFYDIIVIACFCLCHTQNVFVASSSCSRQFVDYAVHAARQNTIHKMSNQIQVLKLYKNLLREASKFKSYYYRNYFSRKVRTEFRRNKNAEEKKADLYKNGLDALAMLRRQTLISNM